MPFRSLERQQKSNPKRFLSPPLCSSLFLSLSLSFFLSVSLSFFLPFSLSLPLSLSLPFSLYLTSSFPPHRDENHRNKTEPHTSSPYLFRFFLSFSLSLFLSVSLSLFLSVSLSLFLSFSLSLSLMPPFPSRRDENDKSNIENRETKRGTLDTETAITIDSNRTNANRNLSQSTPAPTTNPSNNGQQPNDIEQAHNVLNYLLSEDTDEDNNDQKAQKESTDEASTDDTDEKKEKLKEKKEKLKSVFSLLTVVICALFTFAFWYARSQNFSFYGLAAMYVVAYNILVFVHYLDERVEYWLKDKSEHKTTESSGLLLRVVLIANLSFVVYFVSLETARRLLIGNCSQAPFLLQLWNILRGIVANVATMVNFATCRCELRTNPICLTTAGCFSIGRNFRDAALGLRFRDSCREDM